MFCPECGTEIEAHTHAHAHIYPHDFSHAHDYAEYTCPKCNVHWVQEGRSYRVVILREQR